MRKSWFGKFNLARRASFARGEVTDYFLTGVITDDVESRNGRTVELHVERDRMQSMVINLTAEGDLFPNITEGDRVNRLRLLMHLGVDEATARDLTGIPLPDSATPPVRFLG